jgi:hypothetical protein
VPLLNTSEKGNAWRVNSPYELMMPDYAEFLRRFIDGTKPVSMGYLVTGLFKTAFPEGISVEEDASAENQDESKEDSPKVRQITGLTESQEPGAVAVLADVDFISDIVAYQRSIFGLTTVGDNSSMLLNMLEDMAVRLIYFDSVARQLKRRLHGLMRLKLMPTPKPLKRRLALLLRSKGSSSSSTSGFGRLKARTRGN